MWARCSCSTFDAALANWIGQPSLCIFQPTCGSALALEHNGDLYSCDHFVEPAYLLGNIQQDPYDRPGCFRAAAQVRPGQVRRACPSTAAKCDVLFACYGECPRNRFIHTPDGEPGLNYLCAGYKLFFNHIDHPMRLMAELLRRGRYADEVMGILAMENMQQISGPWHKAKPDDPCPCGSGKKFRLCHGRKPRYRRFQMIRATLTAVLHACRSANATLYEERKPRAKEIAIIGLGRFGSGLARRLVTLEHWCWGLISTLT